MQGFNVIVIMRKIVGANSYMCVRPKPTEKFMVSGGHIGPPLHFFTLKLTIQIFLPLK